MDDSLALIAVLVVGAALGWWLEGRAPATRKRVFKATGIVLGGPAVLIVLASVVQSDTLGWIGGLSLMALVALAVPLGLGVLAGKLLGRSRSRDHESGASAQPAPSPSFAKASTPQARPVISAEQRGILIAAAGILSGFWVALALGFRLHDQPIPVELDSGLLPAAIVLIASVSLGLRRAWQWRARRVLSAIRQAHAVDEHKARVAEYERDPHATACCEHLAPIESAMRRAGVRVQPGGRDSAAANCCIDMNALAQKFTVPESVQYLELHSPDRSGLDPPHATLYCTACQSRLWLVHVGEAKPETPTFPAR
jgi:hypothetical protein